MGKVIPKINFCVFITSRETKSPDIFFFGTTLQCPKDLAIKMPLYEWVNDKIPSPITLWSHSSSRNKLSTKIFSISQMNVFSTLKSRWQKYFSANGVHAVATIMRYARTLGTWQMLMICFTLPSLSCTRCQSRSLFFAIKRIDKRPQLRGLIWSAAASASQLHENRKPLLLCSWNELS